MLEVSFMVGVLVQELARKFDRAMINGRNQHVWFMMNSGQADSLVHFRQARGHYVELDIRLSRDVINLTQEEMT